MSAHETMSQAEWAEWQAAAPKTVGIGDKLANGAAVAEVWSSDGGVFYVGSDRYGNTCHGDTLALVVAALAAMAQVSA